MGGDSETIQTDFCVLEGLVEADGDEVCPGEQEDTEVWLSGDIFESYSWKCFRNGEFQETERRGRQGTFWSRPSAIGLNRGK